MKFSLYVSKFILTVIAGMSYQSCFAMQGGSGGDQDPLRNIRYTDAFNQDKIYTKFNSYLVSMGCAANCSDQLKKPAAAAAAASAADMSIVFKEPSENHVKPHGETNSSIIKIDPVMQEAYENACLAQLKSARTWAITEPARESLTMLGLLAAAATGTSMSMGADSFGGSFSIFAVVFNSAYLLRESIRSAYTYAYPPVHALDSLEIKFAKNKCFIPKAFWPKIIETFMTARQNQFAQLKAMDFLQFALGLTIYKPKPVISLNQAKYEQVCNVLHSRIDSYFKDYEFSDKNDKAMQKFCWCIKINLDKFIKTIVSRNNPAPRYIYLCGSGGIGKTYFVQQLSSWIEELVPHSVRFETISVSNAQELEGTGQRPGIMLRILRNQLESNKNASVLFMDEATWLNEPGMLNSAKRVFNGDQTHISTNYFGDGMDGNGLSLAVPPLLIFCAANKKIEEAALSSRFDSLDYPAPKKSTLLIHALKIARNSGTLQRAGIKIDSTAQDKLIAWINAKKIDNFRHIASEVEIQLLQNDNVDQKDAKN